MMKVKLYELHTLHLGRNFDLIEKEFRNKINFAIYEFS